MARARAGLKSLLLIPVLTGCTSFGTIRSAEVQPGLSLSLQASISTPPGEDAAWFWTLDCGSRCDRSIPSTDIGVTVGLAGDERAGLPVAVGAGISGVFPYLDGYVQLGRGERPYGLGARIGVPVSGWSQHQLYGRFDFRRGDSGRISYNPGLFYHTGTAPNGDWPGHFLGLVQGIGIPIEGERVIFTPGLSLIIGTGQRQEVDRTNRSFTTIFGALSMGLSFHGPRD